MQIRFNVSTVDKSSTYKIKQDQLRVSSIINR